MEVLGLLNIFSFLQLLLVIFGALYWFSKKKSNYWQKQGVVHDPPASYFGTIKALLTKSFPESELEKYKKYGRVYGRFENSNPNLTVADPELLRNILVKDFHAFSSRREYGFGDPILDNMVSVLRGEKWKRVRATITPAFTSRKMRKIASIINDSAKATVQSFLDSSEKGIAVDCKRIFGAFSMDVIASSAFATKINSHTDPNNPFVTHGRNSFSTSAKWRIVLFSLLHPLIWKLLGIRFFDDSATNFFHDVALQVIEERKKKGIRGNDFLQLMMDAAKEDLEAKKTIDGFQVMDLEEEEEEEDYLGHGEKNKEILKIDYRKTLTRDELIAQCVIFFMVGYETTAATLSFCAYNLALNPDCQEKLIKEVDEAFEKHGEMTYDVIRDMKYLNCVISETLRMFPALSRAERTATEDYKLGDTGITVPKGMVISFPIYAIHQDPEFYPSPEIFDPDRFSEENRQNRPAYAYLPFGAGPRNCLGMRFALMEMKLCIANMLRYVRFRRCSETKVPIQFVLAQAFLQAKSLMLAIEKRNDVPK